MRQVSAAPDGICIRPADLKLEGGVHPSARATVWDLAITDGLGRDRLVILFDDAGCGRIERRYPCTIEGMSDYAIAFVRALDLAQIELPGNLCRPYP